MEELVEKKEVASKALSLPEQAKRIVIKSQEEYLAAIEFLKSIKKLQKKIDATFDPITKAAWRAYSTARDEKKKVEQASKMAEEILEPIILAWEVEMEQKRRSQEAALSAIAFQKAEDEKMADAQEAMDRGDLPEAEAILNAPVEVPPVVVATPKVEGAYTKKTWKWRLVDIEQVPRIYMKLDEAKIGAIARALKDKASIPGIEVYFELTKVVSVADLED